MFDNMVCPDCGGRIVKAGYAVMNRRGDLKQMWLCTVCRRRTLNPVAKEDDNGKKQQPTAEVPEVRRPSVLGD